jgi:hypothetical protein
MGVRDGTATAADRVARSTASCDTTSELALPATGLADPPPAPTTAFTQPNGIPAARE